MDMSFAPIASEISYGVKEVKEIAFRWSVPGVKLDKTSASSKNGCVQEQNTCSRCYRNNRIAPEGVCYSQEECLTACPSVLQKQCWFLDECDDGKTNTLDWCEEFVCKRQETTCEDLVIKGDEATKLDIVFVAEGFHTAADFQLLREKYPLHIAELLKREPFKPNSNKVNFHLVSGSFDFGYTKPGNLDKARELATKVARHCYPNADEIVVFVNRQGVGETGIFATHGEHYALTSIYDPVMFVHEFGHSFGALGDEYIEWYLFDGEPNRNSFNDQAATAFNSPNIDHQVGCPKWCTGPAVKVEDECTRITDETTCRRHNRYLDTMYNKWTTSEPTQNCVWLPRPHPLFQSRCVKIYDNTDLGSNCLQGAGCYHGAWSSQTFYRPSPDSIMRTLNDPSLGFNSVSIEHMRSLLSKYS